MTVSGGKRGIAELKIEPRIHISGLGANLHELTKTEVNLLHQFRKKLEPLPDAQTNEDYISDAVLVRFLIARDWDITRAMKMIIIALRWRIKRPSHRWCVAVDSNLEDKFRESGSSGKVRVSGVDHHGEIPFQVVSMSIMVSLPKFDVIVFYWIQLFWNQVGPFSSSIIREKTQRISMK